MNETRKRKRAAEWRSGLAARYAYGMKQTLASIVLFWTPKVYLASKVKPPENIGIYMNYVQAFNGTWLRARYCKTSGMHPVAGWYDEYDRIVNGVTKWKHDAEYWKPVALKNKLSAASE